MSHDFYVLYDLETNFAEAIGGSPFDAIPEGMGGCLAKETDGYDFLTHKKLLRDYFVKVVNGYAEFKFRSSNLEFPRNILSDQSIRDLHHRVVFFDYLDIRYSASDRGILLEFDLENLDDNYKLKFESMVNEKNRLFNLYITCYNDPNELLSKHAIDLYQLGVDKTAQLDYIIDRQVSIWGSKKYE
jgi:hypothetical protein